MTPSSTLGAVRTTAARDRDRTHPTSAYSALLATVRDAGLLRRSRLFYMSVLGTLLLALAGCVAGFILLGDSWFQLLIAAALGIVFTQFAFLGHEASHRQVFESGRANDRLGRLLAIGMVGISYSWWMNKHTRHHANPNQIGRDPDIAADTVAFTEEDAATARGFRGAIVRRQGYLFFPLLTLEGLNLHVQSIGHLMRPGKVDARAFELVVIMIRIAVVVAAVFLVLPFGMAFAFLGVQLAVFGVYMGASFAPNHKGMPVVAEREKLDFLRKQVLTSRNITGGWWATALYGGLNHQVEHHLFPSMPRPHLSRAREIVREHCRTQGIAYTEATMAESYAIVIAYLNRVGLHARDPFDCPTAGVLRRS